MTSRLMPVIVVVFAGVSAINSNPAQQITSDVVISGASLNDGYQFADCDEDGRFYRRPMNARPGGDAVSLMRVAKDGSTFLFTLPKPEWSIQVVAPTASGLAVLTNSKEAGERDSNHMYRFDGLGNLQTRRTVSLDFQPVAMTGTKAGMTIVVGYRPRVGRDKEARTYGGAVLNTSDQVVKLFEFPMTTDGAQWTVVHTHRMIADDGAVSVVLQSAGDDPSYAIATITESGQIRILALPTVRGARYHDWFFATGVAAEQYQFAGDKPPGATKIDTFDLASGRKIASKTLLPAGFSVACYLGDEISVLAHNAHVEKSRGLSPDALRLVTVKLE